MFDLEKYEFIGILNIKGNIFYTYKEKSKDNGKTYYLRVKDDKKGKIEYQEYTNKNINLIKKLGLTPDMLPYSLKYKKAQKRISFTEIKEDTSSVLFIGESLKKETESKGRSL